MVWLWLKVTAGICCGLAFALKLACSVLIFFTVWVSSCLAFPFILPVAACWPEWSAPRWWLRFAPALWALGAFLARVWALVARTCAAAVVSLAVAVSLALAALRPFRPWRVCAFTSVVAVAESVAGARLHPRLGFAFGFARVRLLARWRWPQRAHCGARRVALWLSCRACGLSAGRSAWAAAGACASVSAWAFSCCLCFFLPGVACASSCWAIAPAASASEQLIINGDKLFHITPWSVFVWFHSD